MNDTTTQETTPTETTSLAALVPTESTYHFRTVDPATNKKRESIKLSLPLLTIQGLVDIINGGGKGLELLLDIANDTIIERGRTVLTDGNFNLDSVTPESVSWETISNIPKAERTGGGIPKETWEAFAKDYIEVMPKAVPGLTIEQVTAATKHFLNKFSAIKTNKQVITKLKDRLDTWFASTQNAEQFVSAYEALTAKANTLLTADDSSLLENI